MKRQLKFIFLSIICVLTVFVAAKDSSVKIVQVDGNYFRYLSSESSSENNGISLCASYDTESPNPEAEKAIAKGLTELRDEIDISRFNVSDTEFSKIYDRVLNIYSPFFYVSMNCSYSYKNNRVIKLYPVYNYDISEIPAMRKIYEDNLNKILSQVQPEWSDLEKVLFFHDYLVSNFEYDTTYSIFDAYTFLTDGKGVCQAYASVYGILLESVGIKVAPVSSNTMNHAWNKVYMDGEWYHVDCTWDDPLPDLYGMARHRYFLLSDSEMLNREHYDWYSTVSAECTSTKYDNYFWNDVDSPFAYTDGNWYYISTDLSYKYNIMKTPELTAGEPLFSLNLIWGNWGTYFSGLFIKDGRLVYNTGDSVIAYDPKTGISELLWRETGKDSYLIYGSAMHDGDIYYDVKNSPYSDSDIRKLPIPTKGDLNLDGTINSEDLLLLRKYLAGGYNILINRTAADYDGNGNVNMKDVSLLKRSIAG